MEEQQQVEDVVRGASSEELSLSLAADAATAAISNNKNNKKSQLHKSLSLPSSRRAGIRANDRSRTEEEDDSLLERDPATFARLRMYELYKAQLLTDVTLVLACHDTYVHAHRVVLAAASPFFLALFTSGMKESFTSTVELLDEYDVDAFRCLIEYMYTGRLVANDENILAVMHTANQLEMLDAVNACCTRLLGELHASNCVDVYLASHELSLPSKCRALSQAAAAYMEVFFDAMVESEAFKRLDFESMLAILSIRNVRQKNRSFIVPAALEWVWYDEPRRTCFVGAIYQRLGCSMAMNLSTESLPRVTPIDCVLDCVVPKKSKRLMSPNRPRKRRFTETMYAIGGMNGPRALDCVEYLDLISLQWTPVAAMNERRAYCGSAVGSDSRIYVCGGVSNGTYLNTAEVFDPQHNSWTDLPRMTRERSYLGCAWLDGCLYAVGGFNGSLHTPSVEKYDPSTNEWEEAGSLCVGRSGLAVAVANGRLYAIGGYDGHQHLQSVEVYEPTLNRWELMESMQCARNGPAAIAVCGDSSSDDDEDHAECDDDHVISKIMVMGGEARHGDRQDSCEVLDLATGKWQTANSFVDKRSGHGVATMMNEFFTFALGGANEQEDFLDSVFSYDKLSCKWQLHSKMTKPRRGLNVVVAGAPPE